MTFDLLIVILNFNYMVIKCPKCGDPIESGETFCGKCGTPLSVQSNGGGQAPLSGTMPAPSGQPKSKKMLWIILGAVAAVVVVLILWLTGVFGGSAAVTKYLKNTQPEFMTVVDNMNKLNKALSYKTTGETEADIAALQTEVDGINATKAAVEVATTKLNAQTASREVAVLDKDLHDFYQQLTTDLNHRYEIVNYFLTSEKIGDDLARSAGSNENMTDMTKVQEAFRQLKYVLDQSVAQFEKISVPDALKDIHSSDIKILKDMSKILGDLVASISNQDLVSLEAGFTQFERLTSEYETKVTKKYQEILEPEFAEMNAALEKDVVTKDKIEDEFSKFKGKYNIQGATFKLF